MGLFLISKLNKLTLGYLWYGLFMRFFEVFVTFL